MNKSKKLLSVLLIIVISIIAFIFIVSMIKNWSWNKQDEDFKQAFVNEFGDNIGISISTDGNDILPHYTNIQIDKLLSPNFIYIKTFIHIEIDVKGTAFAEIAYNIRNFCRKYINLHQNSKFYSSQFCKLEVYYNHENVICFDDFVDKNEKYQFDQEKNFDSICINATHFNDIELHYFYDCKKIDMVDIKSLDSDYNFDYFQNLKYLNIVGLDYKKDDELIKKISNHIPSSCKFYVSGSLVDY